MSVAQNIIEIERHTAHLSELEGEPPFTIHGIAIGEGDVTRGASGIEKKWPREALKPAAKTLAGQPLVVDHENESHSVVGKVTEAFYKGGTGVLYEAELFDEDLAEKISNGLLEVSIRGFHGDVSDMAESEEGAKIVEKLKFDNLSIVPQGAAQSNSVEIGPSTEMSAAQCAELIQSFDTEDEEDEVDEEENTDAPTEGAEDIRKTDTDRYEHDIHRYPEGTETPPEDSEGMHEYEEENETSDEVEEEEELETHSMHDVSFDGTTESDWDKPALEDFMSANGWDAEEWSDLSEDQQNTVAAHFLVSKSGWPPDNFGDLALPVVEPTGELNLSALQNAKARAGQVSGLSGDKLDKVDSKINSLANENFEGATFGEDEEDEEEMHAIDVVRSTRTSFEFGDGRIVSVEDDTVEELRGATRTISSGDDARDEEAEAEAGDGSEPESTTSEDEEDLTDNKGDNTMTDEDNENQVDISPEELEDLREQADRADELEDKLDELREDFSEDLDSLKERTNILDEVDRDSVESLSEADDPMVIESERFEELESEVDEVREVYAASLSEHVGMDEETLADKFSTAELREQLEDQIDDDAETEEELTPNPKSQDPDEETISEAEEAGANEESPDEEVEEKQAELRQKMGLN